jgi:hypothetical protein
MRVTAFIIAAALTGCATQQDLVWRKPGGSEQEFYSDLGQCRAQAFSVPGAQLMQVAMVQQSCLMGKGWRQVPRQ